MPSEKVTKILISKTDIPETEIAGLSENEAWNIVYATKPPPKERLTEVCFTGFRDTEKTELRKRARMNNLKDVGSVTKNCALLVCGENPGPTKREKAAAQGVFLMSKEDFERFLESGELPPT